MKIFRIIEITDMYMHKPNILLIVLDSVRAQNTSLHGYHHQTTPFLEYLAQTGAFYKHAYNAQQRVKTASTDHDVLDWFPEASEQDKMISEEQAELSDVARNRLEDFGYINND